MKIITNPFALLSLVFLSFNACNCQKKVVTENPDWLDNKIEALKQAPVQNPPASIIEYEYRGALVYYFPAPCCDQFSMLFNAEGILMCHPDGGITGKGDGECPDFRNSRTNERIIWADDRTE